MMCCGGMAIIIDIIVAEKYVFLKDNTVNTKQSTEEGYFYG